MPESDRLLSVAQAEAARAARAGEEAAQARQRRDEAVMHAHESGVGTTVIARALGCSPSAVRNMLKNAALRHALDRSEGQSGA
jgi:DNA-binding NarL/FixJ family response regulator